MTSSTGDSLQWQRLELLSSQFEQNLAALAGRDPLLAARLAELKPSVEYFIASFISGERQGVQMAQKRVGEPLEIIPNRVLPEGAQQIATKLFPTGKCDEPVLVAGLDQGWLWNALYQMEVQTPSYPGHKPPLYFLSPDLERLRMVLHLHDWRALLGDSRTRLFAGDECIGQLRQSLIDHLDVPIPRLSVTIDAKTWIGQSSLDSITADVLAAATMQMGQLQAQLNQIDRRCDPAGAFCAAGDGRPLRVLGITSRYTTFLQHSMRDWLCGFEALGHDTRLLIEPHDSSQVNPIVFAQACADYRPDLIVMIDHYRGEFRGLPMNVPWVMWIQDQLPNIFSPRAGAAQGRYDYTIGYGRNQCVYEHGYPASRFLPVMIGTNERRFQPRRLTAGEYERHACDVSFVSHASAPAEVLLEEEIGRQASPQTREVFETIFARLRARYDAGHSVTLSAELRSIIDESLRELRISVDNPARLFDIFSNKINNALFRHQALAWLTELHERDGVRIHLYGRGWENHPQFATFARGIADNQVALSAIYQASKINLQVSPWGAAHQRVFDGSAAGGFFLFRGTPAERCDRVYRQLWQWCDANQIRNDAELQRAAANDNEVRRWVEQITSITTQDPFSHGYDFVTELFVAARGAFTRSAATLWEEYDQVVFDTREVLHDRVRSFLKDDASRAIISRGMRQRTLQCMTYTAVARQALEFIQRDLPVERIAAAA